MMREREARAQALQQPADHRRWRVNARRHHRCPAWRRHGGRLTHRWLACQGGRGLQAEHRERPWTHWSLLFVAWARWAHPCATMIVALAGADHARLRGPSAASPGNASSAPAHPRHHQQELLLVVFARVARHDRSGHRVHRTHGEAPLRGLGGQHRRAVADQAGAGALEGEPGKGCATFDTIAIIERLHELYPKAGFWPTDVAARTRARSWWQISTPAAKRCAKPCP